MRHLLADSARISLLEVHGPTSGTFEAEQKFNKLNHVVIDELDKTVDEFDRTVTLLGRKMKFCCH